MFKKEFKKNFLRVKQQMDQNLGRAEKTEALPEDLVHLEKRVDNIKETSQKTVKKISSTLPGLGTDVDKRLKKIPEWGVHMNMVESASILGQDTLLGNMYALAADTQSALAQNLLQLELDVEKEVLAPFQQLLDNDIPAINKLRKNLAKLVLDMDSARSRYQSAMRQSTAQGTNKTDHIKDEMEDAQIRVDQCRDQLATEMYNFVSKESDYCNTLVQLVEAQAKYHENALEAIKSKLPRMKSALEQSSQMPVYGQGLVDHLRRTERDIATVIETCVCTLLEQGYDEEGLFRVAGPASKVKKLKASFDSGGPVDLAEYDVHCMAGALKQYLRELPEPLLTYDLYPEWKDATHISPVDQKLQALWLVLDKLPQPNYNNLRYLIKFLAKLASNSSVNKMSASNIAIVIGPNLIWPPGDAGPNMFTTSTLSAIVEYFVTHADWFFPGDVEFANTASLAVGPNPLVVLPNTENNSYEGLTNPVYSEAPTGPLPYPVQPAAVPQSTSPSGSGAPPSPQMAHAQLPHAGGSNHQIQAAYDAPASSPSPVAPRRVPKKPAPPPPAERAADRLSPNSTVPVDSQVHVVVETPAEPSLYPSLAGLDPPSPLQPDRPPIPERPAVLPQGLPEPASPRPRPPERPTGPPPDKPLSSGQGHQRTPSGPERPPGPAPEKPPSPAEAQGHQRTPSGSKLPRPQLPPPPSPHQVSHQAGDLDKGQPPANTTPRSSDVHESTDL